MKRGCSKNDFTIDGRSLHALEYFQIINLLEKQACSPVGQERCRQVRPEADLTEIRTSLSQIRELEKIDDEGGVLPPVDIRDTWDPLRRVGVAGTTLSPQELIDIASNIQTCRRIKRFFTESNAGVHLMALIDRLAVCREISEEIHRCIEPDGRIRDEASPPLLRLRGTIRELRGRVQREMESLLSQEDFQPVLRDRIITQRNGRAVLLVKPEFQGRVQGIVHDCSASRMTLFVEPISVVEINNDLNVLLDEEREEETRILGRLTEGVRLKRPDLWGDLEALGDLDVVYAKMRVSRSLKAIQPEIREGGAIRLLKARHPLLFHRKGDETVPIDLILERDHPVLVISGANAGGKTVALKTLGLLVLMFQSGMEIPTGEGSEVRVFRKVFAEIGDEQSIGDDLSTFSAHLLHLNEVLQKADADSLVLVDEIGGGTNMVEGAALAMGVLDHLKTKGAAVVVTTHLEPLKGYGYVTAGVTNAAVAFDPETLQPLYRLSYGVSAPSHAFLVAAKMGFSRDVLEKAGQYRQETEGPAGALIQRLEELQADVNRERDHLQKLQEETSEKRRRLEASLKRIQERRDQILLRVEERGRKLLSQAEREIGRLLEGPSPAEPGKKKPRRELREIESRLVSHLRPRRRQRSRVENLRPGEWVRVLDLNREGTVSEVQETIDTAEIVVGPFKIKTSLDNLERTAAKETPPGGTTTATPIVSSDRETRREINVIGLTVDEALAVVDHFIDRALLDDLDTVTIIHGSGSGRLRDAIRDFLKEHRAVTGFGHGDPLRGGLGVTVVRLGWNNSPASSASHDDRARYG